MLATTKFACLAVLVRAAVLEASAELGSFVRWDVGSTGEGCAETMELGPYTSQSAAIQACAADYWACYGVYSPDCASGAYTLCARLADGSTAPSPESEPGGCIAQAVIVTAAPTPSPTPAPTPSPPQSEPAEGVELGGAAVDLTDAPTAAPTQGTPAPTAAPGPTPSFDVINGHDCDDVTCTLAGQTAALTCRQQMVTLMAGGGADAGSMPATGITCDAAHAVLSQSDGCRDCFVCDLCEPNVTGSLATTRLFQEKGRSHLAARTAAGVPGFHPFRRPALVVASITGVAGVAMLVFFSIKLSRRHVMLRGEQQPLCEVAGSTGPADALPREERMAFGE